MKNKQQPPLSPEKYIRTRARTLPVGDCYINDNWQEAGTAMITVSRQHPNGNITFALYMVDLFCLGVKDSYWKFNERPLDFKEFMDKQKQAGIAEYKLQKTQYPLVHNIIFGAIEYAGEYGFHPHKSFEVSRFLLEEDDEHIPIIDIVFGHNGKPLFISNPDNPVERSRVLAHLEKNVGKGNYDYITEADADDYLNREGEENDDGIDYSDPVVKAELIRDVLEITKITDDRFIEDPLKLIELLRKAEIVFINYMVSGDEVENAFESIEKLFDFSVSGETFSDEMLFGNSPVTENADLIREEALRLYMTDEEEKPDAIKKAAEKLIRKYPGVPVFHYLLLKGLMLNRDYGKNAPTLKEYAVTFPDYLPIIYLNLESSYTLMADGEEVEFPEHLHLKNFYPGKHEFCAEEAELYFRILILFYGITGQTLNLLVLLSINEENFSELVPVSEILSGKVMILPEVIEWCEAALKE